MGGMACVLVGEEIGRLLSSLWMDGVRLWKDWIHFAKTRRRGERSLAHFAAETRIFGIFCRARCIFKKEQKRANPLTQSLFSSSSNKGRNVMEVNALL